jgi:hypothetical protein
MNQAIIPAERESSRVVICGDDVSEIIFALAWLRVISSSVTTHECSV